MHLSMIAVMQLEDETWKDETTRVVGTEAKRIIMCFLDEHYNYLLKDYQTEYTEQLAMQ